MPRDKVLLFDLGGVLVNVAPVDHALRTLGLPSSPEQLERLASLDTWLRLEVGAIDGDAFAGEFITALALEMQPERLLLEFEAWNLGFFEGSVELLTALRERHRTAVLSNTNEIHWRRLSGEMGVPGLVEVAFASHLIGLRKPDAACYEHVATELGVTPEDLVFFDDNAANIEAALSLGIDAHQVLGIDALREKLTTLGYL